MALPYQKAISGNVYQSNGGTVLGAGNFTSGNVTQGPSLKDNAVGEGYGTIDVTASSPTSSGNIGVGVGISGNEFAKKDSGNTYTGTMVTADLAGPAGNKNRKKYPTQGTTRRLDIETWSLPSGTKVVGANAGDSVDFGADHEHTLDGEFSYLDGGKDPTAEDYSSH